MEIVALTVLNIVFVTAGKPYLHYSKLGGIIGSSLINSTELMLNDPSFPCRY